MRHVVETKEVIEIPNCYFVAFQISDGIQVVVLGALRGLQDVKIPMYITFVAVVGFPFQFIWGCILTKSGWDLIGLLVGLSLPLYFCIFASLD
jgi:MATE family multidrug resistance protein